LLERGVRSLAFLGHIGLGYAKSTAEGFELAARRRGAVCHRIMLQFRLHSDWHWRTDSPELVDWVRALPPPAGVMACNDYFARQILEVAEQIGRGVPDDIAVVGVNDNPMECLLSRVPLSSVALPGEQIGWEACHMLQSLMHGDENVPECVRVPPIGVVMRRSTEGTCLEDAVVAAAVRWIQTHALRPIGVNDLVHAIGLSRRVVENRFRAAIGSSPYHEIIRMRVHMARDLLVHSGLTVDAIASKCGFGQAKTMHRHFHRFVGVTPGIYRKVAGRR
jgi:LacI family transcriptional regulator